MLSIAAAPHSSHAVARQVAARERPLRQPSQGRLQRFVGSRQQQTDPRRQLQAAGRLCQAPRAAAAAAGEAATVEETPLQAFLRWLVGNGVQGVGAADSKIALFQGEGGERGVVSLQPIAAKEVVMRIPMRLAVTDQVEDEASPEAEQPWSVRLAGRLLAMGAGQAGAGGESPWTPYLEVLPKSVPSPLTAFSWEDVQAIEYQPMLRALEHATWLASSAAQQPGGSRFGREEWDRALSVVHSRTFGAPGPAGGVGVRMLVPLVDMLNHAGDYLLSPPGAAEPRVQAFENVRWDLRAPSSPDGEWCMEVVATRAIAAGEELLLSYGERNNDDFLLHYGFVPPRNPHDDVALFTDIESAVDWWLDAFLPLGALPPERLQAAINGAYTAAEEQDAGAMAAEAVLRAVPEAEADVIRAELARIKLLAGGMVDGRLLAAFRALHAEAAVAAAQAQAQQAAGSQQEKQGQGGGGALGATWEQHLRLALVRRCREILASMPTPLLDDLRRLAAWEQASGQAQHCWAQALQHYSPALAAWEAKHGSLAAGAPPASAGGAGEQAGSGGDVGSGSAAPVLDAGAAGEDAALARLLLQQAQAQSEAEAVQEEGAAGGGPSILPVIYRCYKKLVLADAILLSS